MAIYQLGEDSPSIAGSAWVAEEAVVTGKVELQADSSIWPFAAIRGDNELISIGEGSNVQEGAVLHTDPGYPLTVGKNVTIGHQAMLHGCTVHDGALIGIHAVVLNGAVIGKNCLVGAGSVVTEGKVFPENSLILGAPAKVVRTLTPEALAGMGKNSSNDVKRKDRFRATLKRIG
ncbi:MAG: gamma carbonic anhydrase family protein [Candidatus Protistobacter heckmanni]|nr:gamma carbonic anhydrase family protein [Candidatus Protistobacter heckmanni]